MIGKAEAAGLIVDPVMKATVLPAQNTPGSRYAAPFAGSPPRESLTGLWWLVEFIPKTYKDPAANFATKWMIAAARPLSRNSLTTAIWPSRWSRLPPFPAANTRGVLPFASGPSTLAHGPAKTASRGFARRRYLQTAFAGWGRSSLSRRRYSRAFGSTPRLRRSPNAATSPDVMAAQRSSVGVC
jgi:hypothetical protein